MSSAEIWICLHEEPCASLSSVVTVLQPNAIAMEAEAARLKQINLQAINKHYPSFFFFFFSEPDGYISKAVAAA